jgi:type IV pilus assembly protein PilA
MQDRNPYAAPRANVMHGESGAEEYGEVRVFSVSGRIGRVRYIAYSIGFTILALIVTLIVAGLVALTDPTTGIVVAIVGYVVAVYGAPIVPAIQRSHDMNVTGWLALLVLVPLAPLAFWLIPGTRGENSYGRQPPPNGAGVILVACIVPFVGIGGVLAAIAVPAYQDYSIRAQVTEGLTLASGPRVAVVEAFERDGAVPADRVAVGLSADPTDTAGQYVDSVDVVDGTIVVSFGANANEVIAGSVLAIQPYVMGDESVVWRCGHAAPPAGGVAMGAFGSVADLTDIEPRHLPSACRP